MTELKDKVAQAMESAAEAFSILKKQSGKERAVFLRRIGQEIQNLGDQLIQTTVAESNLPEARITGERGRTIDQLNKFADLLEAGSWVEATIDTGDPNRQPLPKPDIRRLLVPIGPVIVFGAGNFPLAFSVAGGDTASALAGGNPVVVKGHPAHPQTSELVAGAIRKAVAAHSLPEGTFSLIQDSGHQAGKLLVQHPAAKAVAFTGSQAGGMALIKLAAERDEPIPVFAEMGSINPVVILKEAMKTNHPAIAAKLVASVNQGAGQFCTNPGLLITTKTEGFDRFLTELAGQVKAASANRMFSDSVFRNYQLNSEKMLAHRELRLLAQGETDKDSEKVPPAIATVSAKDFMLKPSLHEEVFGPFSLLVVCDHEPELLQVVKSLKGQLTATVHGLESELSHHTELIDALIDRCGRLLLNGVPTGVEVCSAMQHGGPFPAASDSRFTSVGVAAIKRFVRPVCYQDFPQELLPAELQNANPLNIWRTVNNEFTQTPIR